MSTLYEQIRARVIEKQHASMTMLTRGFKISFKQSLEMLDQLESDGVISAEDSTRQRTVLIGGNNDR